MQQPGARRGGERGRGETDTEKERGAKKRREGDGEAERDDRYHAAEALRSYSPPSSVASAGIRFKVDRHVEGACGAVGAVVRDRTAPSERVALGKGFSDSLDRRRMWNHLVGKKGRTRRKKKREMGEK